jgi:hypothetical protein
LEEEQYSTKMSLSSNKLIYGYLPHVHISSEMSKWINVSVDLLFVLLTIIFFDGNASQGLFIAIVIIGVIESLAWLYIRGRKA